MPGVLVAHPWLAPAGCVVLLLATLLAGAAIKKNDAHFAGVAEKNRDSAILEWQMNANDAESIVRSWRDAGMMKVAYRGLALDTFVFIPLYSTAIAFLCFFAAQISGAGTMSQRVFLALAWCGWVAGAFDLIENAGIFVEESLGWYFVATPTAIMALMKWGLAIVVTLAALGRLVTWPLMRR